VEVGHDHPCTATGEKYDVNGKRLHVCEICGSAEPYGKEEKDQKKIYLKLEAYKPLKTGRLTTREKPEAVMTGKKREKTFEVERW
jgi:hypothetical protein